MYLAAQHTNSKQEFISYASPRLRREAKPQLTKIQNSFHAMTSALITSRHSDTVELALALDTANKQAELAASKASTALEEERSAHLAKDARIAKLEAILAASTSSPLRSRE